MKEEFIALIGAHEGILRKIWRIYFDTDPCRDDYYQEMLIRLWRAYPSFRGEAAVSTWIYRVALNTAIDLLRKRALWPRPPDNLPVELHLPDREEDLRDEQRELLYRVIRTLGESDRAIILLYLEGHSYREIADVMGITENNTGVRINRIKKQLIKILKP